MIGASSEVKSILKEALAIHAKTRVIAEWNMNRFVGVASIGNGDYEDDPLFPIRSVVSPLRPGRGIVKARTTYVSKPSFQDAVGGRLSSLYTNDVTESRYYAPGTKDPYKYYSTSVPATERVMAFVYAFVAPQRPFVVYEHDFYCNKLVVGIENSVSSPVDFSVQTTLDGVTWTTIATNPPIDSQGQVILWLSDANGWTATPNYDNVTKIRGVRVIVNSMDKDNAHFDLIEISPRLENDLTDYIIDWDADYNMSDTSFILPIGHASSNVGALTVSNIDSRFSNDNINSLYYDLIDKNVRFKVDFGVKKADGTYEYIRQLTMYAQSWSPDSQQTINIALKDSSSFAQDEIVPATYIENHTVGAIIWRLMDMMGHTNYNYVPLEDDSFIVPFFWTNGEESLWEVISKLCETTQTAIYFDEFDTLQIKSKKAAYNVSRPVDWNMTAIDGPGVLANVIDLNQSSDYESNAVDIRYQTTEYSQLINGFPQMEVSWEPEDTVVLRASPIRADIVQNSQYIRILQNKAESWPYSAMVNIGGELIRYDGKVYYYYDLNGNLVSALVKSLDEKNAIDKQKSSQDLSWKNYFSGDLKIIKRGERNTSIKDHMVKKDSMIQKAVPVSRTARNYFAVKIPTEGWNIAYTSGSSWTGTAGNLRVVGDSSYARLDNIHLVSINNALDTVFAPARFGTRVKFVPNGWPTATQGIATMQFLGGNGHTGIYATIHTTALTNTHRWHNEITLGVKDVSGKYHTLRNTNGTRAFGQQQDIVTDVWYDLEATVYKVGSSYSVTLFVNGVQSGNYLVPMSMINPVGLFGVGVRSHCTAEFEYLYAFGPEPLSDTNPDELTSYLDLIQGDYRSKTVRDYQNYKGIRPAYFFDEFSPIVHEVREYDIKFDKSPVLHSYLYFSNDSQVVCTEYAADPFGARFTIANASREDAILNGEDAITFGSENRVDQKMFVYGRLLNQADYQSVKVENQDGIRRRGKAEAVVESIWVQTEEMAKSIGDWVIDNWAGGCDEINIECFYNPLLQVGDLVTVTHPMFHMTDSTHKYFLVDVKRRFGLDGPTCSLRLRRAHI